MPSSSIEDRGLKELKAKAKKVIQTTRNFQTALSGWQTVGGAEKVLQAVNKYQEGLKKHIGDIDEILPALPEKAALKKRRDINDLITNFRNYCKENKLVFREISESRFQVGPYRTSYIKGRPMKVTFAGVEVGSIDHVDLVRLSKTLNQVRKQVEVQTPAFLEKLKEAYDRLSGGRANVPLLELYKAFVLALQSKNFWKLCNSNGWKSYSQANFAWEIFRESSGKLPFEILAATVAQNVGPRPNLAHGVYLIFPQNLSPKLFSSIRWSD